jgi:5,10-methylenetetrahydromethanopterin reductase
MDGFGISAYVSVVPHADRAVARRMAAGNVASFARFSTMHGRATGSAAGNDQAIYERLHDSYTMRGHMRDGSPQSEHLTDDAARPPARSDSSSATNISVYASATHCRP